MKCSLQLNSNVKNFLVSLARFGRLRFGNRFDDFGNLSPAVTLVFAVAAAVSEGCAVRGALEFLAERSDVRPGTAVAVRPATGRTASRSLAPTWKSKVKILEGFYPVFLL